MRCRNLLRCRSWQARATISPGCEKASGSQAGRGAGEEEIALAGVAGEGGGAFEFYASFFEAVEFEEKVAADAGQEVIIFEGGLGSEGVDEFEASGGAEGHGEGDGAIQFHNG